MHRAKAGYPAPQPAHPIPGQIMTDADARLTMQDPRTQYPQPPFARQPQDAPGLAQAMDPKPDHGETSYRGHGRLEGRKALVTGADLDWVRVH